MDRQDGVGTMSRPADLDQIVFGVSLQMNGPALYVCGLLIRTIITQSQTGFWTVVGGW